MDDVHGVLGAVSEILDPGTRMMSGGTRRCGRWISLQKNTGQQYLSVSFAWR